MSKAKERISLQSRLGAFASSQVPPLAVQWEGFEFEAPKNTPWIAAVIITSPDSRFSTIGATKWIREHKIFQININVPSQFGTKPAEDLGDLIAALYTGQIQDAGAPCITFFPSSLKSVGSRNGYYTAILSVPFQSDFQES